MIEPVSHRWRSVLASVSDSVKVPSDVECVSLPPAAVDSDEVTVSFLYSTLPKSSTQILEMESRPIQTETTAQDETSRTIFRRYPINVPVPVGEIATVYFLGETDKERRML